MYPAIESPEYQWVHSLRAGPNGSPAMMCYAADADMIHETHPHLAKLIYEQAEFHGLDQIEKVLEYYSHRPGDGWQDIYLKRRKLMQPRKRCVSRLEFLSEGGGKTRVVALGDIYTQSVCQPLHRHLASILRSLSSDCTFDQEKGVRHLKNITKGDKTIFCFDLSNCTDRFPLFLQKGVIAYLSNESYASR